MTTPTRAPAPSPYAKLTQLLDELAPLSPKTAAEEPQGQGALSVGHPTAKADDGTIAATTGARASEMSSELKAQQANSIDAAADADPNRAQEVREADIGMTVTGIGKDPAQEDNYIGKLKEPGVGTSTEAKFEDGEKYASLSSFSKLAAAEQDAYLSHLGNELLATAMLQHSNTPVVAANKTAADQLISDAQAGYDLAAQLGMAKSASAQQQAKQLLEATINDALADADLVGEFLKRAEEEAQEEEDPNKPKERSENPSDGASGESSGGKSPNEASADTAPIAPGGGGPSADHGAGGASGAGAGGDPAAGDAGVPSEAEVAQALNSIGGGAPGGDMGMGAPPPAPGGMGGAPGMGAPPPAPGMPPDAGMGGAPPMGGPPGMGGAGGVGQDEILQELLAALQEMGLTPEDLAAAAGGMGAAGAPGQKMAAAAKAYQRSGKYQIKEAGTPRSRYLRDNMKKMLGELL